MSLMMNSKILIGILIILIFLAGCTAPSNQTGTLQGYISISPICPVERNPPDPRCQPTAETYQAYALDVFKLDQYGGYENAGKIVADAEGNYSIELAAGNYVLDLKNKTPFFEKKWFSIEAGKTEKLDVDIDTGIR